MDPCRLEDPPPPATGLYIGLYINRPIVSLPVDPTNKEKPTGTHVNSSMYIEVNVDLVKQQ